MSRAISQTAGFDASSIQLLRSPSADKTTATTPESRSSDIGEPAVHSDCSACPNRLTCSNGPSAVQEN